METIKTETVETETVKEPNYNRRGRALGGLIVVAVGVFWLLKRMDLVIFPTWVFTWPVFMIALGLYIGIRKGFARGGWFMLMLIGGVFLIPEVLPGATVSDYTWPILVIVVGLYMILRPKRDFNSMGFHSKWQHHGRAFQNTPFENAPYSGYSAGETSEDDYIDATSIFGGVNKVIVSKNFKGGDIVNIFGGCDLNLTQADFKGTVTIEIVQIFGGAKIIVPTDWKVIVKTTSIFGGIEDKRPPALIKENPDKTLILEGTSIFAGIGLQCY